MCSFFGEGFYVTFVSLEGVDGLEECFECPGFFFYCSEAFSFLVCFVEEFCPGCYDRVGADDVFF